MTKHEAELKSKQTMNKKLEATKFDLCNVTYVCLYCGSKMTKKAFDGYHGECEKCIARRLDVVADRVEVMLKLKTKRSKGY